MSDGRRQTESLSGTRVIVRFHLYFSIFVQTSQNPYCDVGTELLFGFINIFLYLYRQARIPTVMWAQRSDVIFLTVNLEDCKNPNIDLKENKLFFRYSMIMPCINS